MGLFSKKWQSSFALITIDAASVGGALTHATGGAPPVIYYSLRQTIEPKEHETLDEAMLRTLHDVAGELVTKGSPILRQETKTGHIDRILVSVGAPWQMSSVRIETIEDKKPFIFSKALVSEATRHEQDVPKGYLKSGESVIATLLNGYETLHPFGKKVNRVDLYLLSSLLEASVANDIERLLRRTYHTHALTLTAFAPVAYSVFRDVYPHEKDFLVVEVSGEATDIALTKHGLLVNVASIPHGINTLIRDIQDAAKEAAPETFSPESVNLINPSRNASFAQGTDGAEKEWLNKVAAVLREFASRSALPRTLFLLAGPETRDYLRNTLDSPELRMLWLTDDPLRVIATVPKHFGNFVKTRTDVEGDIFLEMLALFGAKTATNETNNL